MMTSNIFLINMGSPVNVQIHLVNPITIKVITSSGNYFILSNFTGGDHRFVPFADIRKSRQK